jgi:hypothetical protein
MFPLTWHRGTLRTVSDESTALVVSPYGLGLPASQYQYVKVRLWTRHADRAYIAFITDEDEQWDTDLSVRFRPAVHTSFFSYQRAFASRKLKLLPLSPGISSGESAVEYVVDMHEVPAWKGRIKQIGILTYTAVPGSDRLEIGLEQVDILDALTPLVSIYNAPPWVFLRDEEGWRTFSQGALFGAAYGGLYLQSDTAPIVMISAPGQQISPRQVRYVQIRMQTSGTKKGYILLRHAQDRPFEKYAPDMAKMLTETSLRAIPFSLQASPGFHVYTIPLPEFEEKIEAFSQIGLFFPAVSEQPMETEQPARQVFIDYVALLGEEQTTDALLPDLLQKTEHSLEDVAARIRQQNADREPQYGVSYEALPQNGERFYDADIPLVKVSPREPGPLEIAEDGRITLRDTGTFRADNKEVGAPLRKGERYTYSIGFVDRKGRTPEQPAAVTVNFTAVPRAPLHVSALASDRSVKISWQRPFLDTNGEKLRTFDGYRIYRSSEPGEYGDIPLHKAGFGDTSFVDRSVVNGETYYYVVQSISSVTESVVAGEFSDEVSATPEDHEAPDAPIDLTSAYVNKVVKLFWKSSASPDWKGFYVYRSQSSDGPFKRLTSQLLQHPSYEDRTSVAGKTYYYYVTSLDGASPPNESHPSKIVRVRTGRR